MKLLALFIACLFSCSTPPIINHDKDILTKNMIVDDISYATNMLENAYAGFRFHDQKVIKKSISILDRIASAGQNLTKKDFCDQMEKAVEILPDNHLYFALPRQNGYFPCGSIMSDHNKKKDKMNLQKNPQREWDVITMRTPKGKQVKVLAISSFGGAGNLESKHWQEFINTARVLLSEPYFIMDLRDNGGGSDSSIKKWIEEMIAGKHSVMREMLQLQTREAYEIRYNQWKMDESWSETEEDRNYYREKQAREKRGIEELKQEKKPKWFKRQIDPLVGKAKHTYSGKIYVLTNGGTGSAAESMVEYLDTLFNVVKVGSNTSGTYHFGNIGMAVLPKSGIYLQMGISFSPSPKYGFIEKVGIKPNVLIKDPSITLNRVLELIDE